MPYNSFRQRLQNIFVSTSALSKLRLVSEAEKVIKKLTIITILALMISIFATAQQSDSDCLECTGHLRVDHSGNIYSFANSILYEISSHGTVNEVYDLTGIFGMWNGYNDYVVLRSGSILFYNWQSSLAPIFLVDLTTLTATTIDSPTRLTTCNSKVQTPFIWYGIQPIGDEHLILCSVDNSHNHINVGRIIDNELIIDYSFDFGRIGNINHPWLDIASSRDGKLYVVAKPNEFAKSVVPSYTEPLFDRYIILRFDLETATWDYVELFLENDLWSNASWFIPELVGVDELGNIYTFVTWVEEQNNEIIARSYLAKYDDAGVLQWTITEADFNGIRFNNPALVGVDQIVFNLGLELTVVTCNDSGCVP